MGLFEAQWMAKGLHGGQFSDNLLFDRAVSADLLEKLRPLRFVRSSQNPESVDLIEEEVGNRRCLRSI